MSALQIDSEEFDRHETVARTNGIEIATTAPARRPRATRLTATTIAMASHRASMKSFTGVLNRDGLFTERSSVRSRRASSP